MLQAVEHPITLAPKPELECQLRLTELQSPAIPLDNISAAVDDVAAVTDLLHALSQRGRSTPGAALEWLTERLTDATHTPNVGVIMAAAAPARPCDVCAALSELCAEQSEQQDAEWCRRHLRAALDEIKRLKAELEACREKARYDTPTADAR